MHHLFISPRIRRLIDLALEEDELGFDVTSQIFFAGDAGRASLVAKEEMVICGLDMVRAVYDRVDSAVHCVFDVHDGELVTTGTTIGHIEGSSVSILRGERTALNFLQRMTGVASLTASYIRALDSRRTRIVDTRKTLPGFRELDKYAVRCGGGGNHRFNLAAGILIKDNHIAAAGGVTQAVERVREHAPHALRIEVEVTTLDELDAALDADADIVMLDNMDTDTMRVAIGRVRDHQRGRHVLIEASGNMSRERLPELRELDLDLISVGALTHSPRAADISMRMTHRGDHHPDLSDMSDEARHQKARRTR
jgi:nicotinate-nucleotide pyrophosphorylase (carboxylating)